MQLPFLFFEFQRKSTNLIDYLLTFDFYSIIFCFFPGNTFSGEANIVRIIRSCGNIRNVDKSCYRTSDSQVKTETCECYHPLCNTGDPGTSSTLYKILIPALAAILFNLS